MAATVHAFPNRASPFQTALEWELTRRLVTPCADGRQRSPTGGPVDGIAPSGLEIGVDALDDIGLLRGDVGGFTDVVVQIIEDKGCVLALGTDAFPSSLIKGGLGETAFVKFPVKELVLFLFGGISKKRGNEADGIEPIGSGRSSQLGGGGEPIAKVGNVIGNAPRRDAPRPPGDGGHANATVGKGPFDAAKRAGGLESVEVMIAFVVGTVVAGEEDKRVFGEAKQLQVLKKPTDITVHAGDHGGVAFVLVGPVQEGVGPVIGDVGAVFEFAGSFVVGVWDDEVPVEEERTVLVIGDERKDLVGEEIIGKETGFGGVTGAVAADGSDEIGQGDALFVVPQEIGEMIVGMTLVEVAEEQIETLFARQSGVGWADVAETPFADERGGIASLLQGLGHREIVGAQGLRLWIGGAGIAANAGAAMMFAGHEDAAGRGTDGGAGIELDEAKAFIRHTIEVRGLDDLLPVTAEFAITEIIGHDPDQVWAVGGGGDGFAIPLERLGHLGLSRIPAMDVEAVPQGEGIARLDADAFHARPASADETVMAQQPGGVVIARVGVTEHRDATEGVAIPKSRREIGPFKPFEDGVLAQRAAVRGDRCLLTRRVTEAKRAVTAVCGAAEVQRPVTGLNAQFNVNGPALTVGAMDDQPHGVAGDDAIADLPDMLGGERSVVGFDSAFDPTVEVLADPLDVPEIVGAWIIADLNSRPHPRETAMMIMIGGKIIGQDFAVETVDGMNVRGAGVTLLHARLKLVAEVVAQHGAISFAQGEGSTVVVLDPGERRSERREE
jgi:hypothetical protein